MSKKGKSQKMWSSVKESPQSGGWQIRVGPERIVLTDAMQPIMFRTSRGTLYVSGGSPWPPGITPPDRNRSSNPCAVVSRDNGRTWKRWLAPQPQAGGIINPFNPLLERQSAINTHGNALELSDGRVVVQEWVGDGPTSKGDWHARYWESHDDLVSFTGPHIMTIHLPQARCGFDDGGHPYSGLTFHRSLLELLGGDLLTTVYCWFEGDVTSCTYQPPNCKYRCILLRSQDKGRNWKYVNTIAVDPTVGEEGFDEPVVVRLSRGSHVGRLVCLMRTGSNNCPIHQSYSDDEGVTWSVPRPLPFGGVDPDLIEMADGTLACSVGWRIWGGGEMQNYYVVFSRDGSETWTDLTVIPLETYAATKYPSGTWYSSLREIAPGVLLVVYDYGAFDRDWPVRYLATREVHVTAAPGHVSKSVKSSGC